MSVTVEPTDADLVAAMADGDKDAFAALFRRHQATVYRFSRQMLGAKDAAEDVTQDVFVALAHCAGKFDPAIGSLTTYLYGIARNLILQRHKRGRARTEIDINSLDAEDAAPLATRCDLADALARAQMVRQLRKAILRLPLHYREVVVLCELNGLSYEDAAAVAGCPVGTIRSRLNRARQMLIERCRAVMIPEEQRAKSKEQRAKGKEHRAKGKEQREWLILTKNNC